MKRSLDDLLELADKGRTASMIELGHNYLKGFDYEGNEFPCDYGEAKKWLEKAHEKGATTASFFLGSMYETGTGVPHSLEKAAEFYELATQRGGYLSHLHLARIYAKGFGESESQMNAEKWYRSVLSFDESEVDGEHIEEAKAFLKI